MRRLKFTPYNNIYSVTVLAMFNYLSVFHFSSYPSSFLTADPYGHIYPGHHIVHYSFLVVVVLR